MDVTGKNFEHYLEKVPALLSFFIAISFLLSVAFNVGYMLPLGIDFISYFCAQDYLEGSIPLLLLGGGITLAHVIPFHLKQESSYLSLCEKYRKDWKSFSTIEKFLISPFFLFFFILQSIGTLSLYIIIYIFSAKLIGAIESSQTSTFFFKDSYHIYGIALLWMILDIFLRYFDDRKRYIRFFLVRLFLASALFMGILGATKLAKDLTPSNDIWQIIYADGTQTKSLQVLRPIEKGLLTYDPTTKSITLTLWPQINSVTRLQLSLSSS